MKVLLNGVSPELDLKTFMQFSDQSSWKLAIAGNGTTDDTGYIPVHNSQDTDYISVCNLSLSHKF